MTVNRKLAAAALVLACAAAANAFVAHHAWVMTHFDESAQAPVPPERQILAQRVSNVLFGVRLPRARNSRTPADAGLPYETHTISGRGGRDLEAWHVTLPRAKGLVVLFHGFGKAKESHIASAALLRELGYESLLVDFYGFGGSRGNSSTIGWLEALDVEAAAKHGRRLAGRKPLILLGSSMGAAAVLRASALGLVSPDGVVLEAPYLRFVDSVRRRMELMRFPVTTPFAEWLTLWGGILNGFNTFTMNPVDWAAKTRAPALVLFGEQDLTIKSDEADKLYEALAAASKSRYTFPGIGHLMFAQKAPGVWQARMAEFLRGLPAAGSPIR